MSSPNIKAEATDVKIKNEFQLEADVEALANEMLKQAGDLFDNLMAGPAPILSHDGPLLPVDVNGSDFYDGYSAASTGGNIMSAPLVHLNKPGKRSFEEMMAAITGSKPGPVKLEPQMPSISIMDMEGNDCIIQPLTRRTRRTRPKAVRDAEKAALNGEPQKKKRKRFPRIVVPQPLKWDVPKELQKPAMDANLLVAHESVGALLTILPGLPALKREPEEAYTSNVSLEALAASARDATGHAGPSVIIKREDLTRCRG